MKGERAIRLALLFCLCAALACPGLSQSKFENQKSKIEPPLPFGTIRSQRLERGIPLGGIGCGTFQVLTDGTISRATINNNWSKPTGDLNGCFAAVWTSAGGRIAARALSLKSAYGLPTIAGLDYLGRFPQALLQYSDPALPISLSLRAFSPLVPEDMMASTLPAAFFVFTIRNEARAPVEASIALSWENFIGVGGTAAAGAFADRTGNTVATLPQTEGMFGMLMKGPARPATDPANRFYYNAQGSYALMALPTTPDTVVTVAGWNALDGQPGWWPQFAKEGTVVGSVGVGAEGSVHPAGVIALKVSLKAGESRELPFVFAWYTPRLYVSDGVEYGHYYEKMFDSAPAAGRFALENRLAFAALTDEWQNRLLRSTLPPALVQRLINDAALLTTNSVYTRDSGLGGTKPGPALFALLEQPGGNPDLGAMDRRLFAHSLVASLFPRLDLQEIEQFVALQRSSGAVPRLEGEIDEAITGERPTRSDLTQAGIAGSSASFAFQIGQYYLWTGDRPFLDLFYPAAKHALEFAAQRTLAADVTPPVSESERALVRGALRCGERMATAIDDRRFVSQCQSWAKQIAPSAAQSDSIVENWMRASISQDNVESVTPTASGPMAMLQCALAAMSGNADTALSSAEAAELHPVPSENALAAASSWNVLRALSGPLYEPSSGRLMLTCAIPRRVRTWTLPLFAPTLWATFDYRSGPNRAQFQFRVDRTLPTASNFGRRTKAKSDGNAKATTPAGAIVIRQVILPAPENRALHLTASLNRSPLTGTTAEDGGHIVFTPDSPVTLSAGQRIEFLFRP
jgi:uncharacterized protein (DUF608 family)